MNTRKRWTWWVLPIAMLALTGCASSSSDDSGGGGAGVLIITALGEHLEMSGDWIACYSEPNDYSATNDASEVFTFSGSRLDIVYYVHGSTGGVCSDTGTEDSGATMRDITLELVADVTTAGWVLSGDALAIETVAPSRSDGAGFDLAPEASEVQFSIPQESETFVGTGGFLVDDSETPFELYRDDDGMTVAECASAGVDERTNCMLYSDQLIQQ